VNEPPNNEALALIMTPSGGTTVTTASNLDFAPARSTTSARRIGRSDLRLLALTALGWAGLLAVTFLLASGGWIVPGQRGTDSISPQPAPTNPPAGASRPTFPVPHQAGPREPR
jgi:hypothetical protein